MIILSSCSEFIRLACIVLVLPHWWTRFFEWNGLEITGRDRLAVVPPDFQRSEPHFLAAM
jgi:hypothetical protein